MRLLEFGFFNEAFKYIEIISKTINRNTKLHLDKLSCVFHVNN